MGTPGSRLRRIERTTRWVALALLLGGCAKAHPKRLVFSDEFHIDGGEGPGSWGTVSSIVQIWARTCTELYGDATETGFVRFEIQAHHAVILDVEAPGDSTRCVVRGLVATRWDQLEEGAGTYLLDLPVFPWDPDVHPVLQLSNASLSSLWSDLLREGVAATEVLAPGPPTYAGQAHLPVDALGPYATLWHHAERQVIGGVRRGPPALEARSVLAELSATPGAGRARAWLLADARSDAFALDEAGDAWSAIAAHHGNDEDALAHLARLAFLESRFDDALTAVAALRELKPSSPARDRSLDLRRAELLLTLQRYESLRDVLAAYSPADQRVAALTIRGVTDQSDRPPFPGAAVVLESWLAGRPAQEIRACRWLLAEHLADWGRFPESASILARIETDGSGQDDAVAVWWQARLHLSGAYAEPEAARLALERLEAYAADASDAARQEAARSLLASPPEKP